MNIAEVKVLEKNDNGVIVKFAYREKGKKKFIISDDKELAGLIAFFIISKIIEADLPDRLYAVDRKDLLKNESSDCVVV